MKEILCIVCPTGCRMQAGFEAGELVLTGNTCKRGADFARAELLSPTRSLTTTVRTAFPGVPALPVRTDGEIPKGKIAEAVAQLAGLVVSDRVGCGGVVLQDLAGTGCAVIATSNILMDARW